jgi:phospho-N-acetylmuramoyl-pentapeptide-transferase
MLYLWLYPLAGKYPALNVFRYPSFRTVAAGLSALVIGMVMGPWLIRTLAIQQHGQSNVREDTPERHQTKKGTPTLGGLLILGAMCAGTLLFADLTNRYVLAALTITIGFGFTGFLDDWFKLSKRNSKGLAGRYKIILQTVFFLIAIYGWLCQWDFHTAQHFPYVFASFRLDTTLTLPFIATKWFHWDMGWLYLPFAWVVVVGTSNAVNLTDGLDGLAIGPVINSALIFMILAYVTGTTLGVALHGEHVNLAQYLYIEHVEGVEELAVFCAAIAGAGLAFLWFNTYPAQVFMGDVGSLALGGALGSLAILTKSEVVSAIIDGVFLVEILSVMIQVASFKTTGKRVFRMAPIHHHFELKGWAEPKIIVRFWIASIMSGLVALLSLKLR